MKYLLFYTDPGSGMLLLQMLLASVAGAIFYFRSFFYRLFGRHKKEETSKDSETNLSENDHQELK